MNTTVKCQSKNPATCRYHGSSKDYESLNIELYNLSESVSAANSLDEVIRIKREMNSLIEQIDTTTLGYSKLNALHKHAVEAGNFADSIILKQRLQSADRVRAQDEEIIRSSYEPGSHQEEFSLAIERLEELQNYHPVADDTHAYTNVNYYFNGHEANEWKTPTGLTELRTALKNTRGVKNGGVRIVDITAQATTRLEFSDALEIHGPKDGRPLIVRNKSGFHKLIVKSGNVVILADSGSGNVVDVDDAHEGEVVVIAGPDRKVTIHTKKKINIVQRLSKRVWVDKEVAHTIVK